MAIIVGGIVASVRRHVQLRNLVAPAGGDERALAGAGGGEGSVAGCQADIAVLCAGSWEGALCSDRVRAGRSSLSCTEETLGRDWVVGHPVG